MPGKSCKSDKSRCMRAAILPVFSYLILPYEKISYGIRHSVFINAIKKSVDLGNPFIGILYIGQFMPGTENGIMGTFCMVDSKNIKERSDSDGDLTVFPMEGKMRFRIIKVIKRAEIACVQYPTEAEIEVFPETVVSQSVLGDIMIKKCISLINKIRSNLGTGRIPPYEEMAHFSVGHLADKLGGCLNFLEADIKMIFLETFDPVERIKKVVKILELMVGSDQTRNLPARYSPDENAKKAFLAKKNKQNEVEKLKERFLKIKDGFTEDGRSKMEEEFSKLAAGAEDSIFYSVSLNYLSFVISLFELLPSAESREIPAIRQILDEDHYGLQKIKKRIIEYMAVKILNPAQKSPILCFVGPPGVGKTSLGKSIARALNRKFCRWSCGGVSDEAEIRGHRSTYVGALPGRILQAIKNGGTNNPLFMIDEVDKLGRRNGVKGDPESALLEVLDPEQNFSFSDNYVQIGFDLSKVFFIVTANTTDTIPPALKDRLEILRLAGYGEEEKIHIARKFLVPRQLKENGLIGKAGIAIPDEILSKIIQLYTRESGVRSLEREIAKIFRHVAVKMFEDPSLRSPSANVAIDLPAISEILGPQKYFKEALEDFKPGVSIGLAWTPYGGEILYIESAITAQKGSGQLILTGHLGKVMEESARIALSYLRSKIHTNSAIKLRNNIHLHVPSGAIPKDGPSAGLAIIFAFYSLFKSGEGKACMVKKELAVSGEITLRGEVLPVGGIKEKLIGAARAGIKEVILPKNNEGDLNDLPESIRKTIKVHLIRDIDEALDIGFPACRQAGPERK